MIQNASFSAFHVGVFKHVYFYDRQKKSLEHKLCFKLNVFETRDSRVEKCWLNAPSISVRCGLHARVNVSWRGGVGSNCLSTVYI